MKLGRPRADHAIPRPRLFEVLDDLRARYPVVWIQSPAGAGKTTLLSSFIEARRLPCLWYQVGGEDADVASFFYHLGRAARPHATGPLPVLTPENRLGLSGFSRLFFQQLFGALPPGATLVFDNVEQGPAGGAWQTALADGLALLPDGMTAFLLSREGPFPALARERARQRVHVLGFDHLRLTAAESEEVAHSVLAYAGHTLPAATTRRVLGLADGWAAGLVLLLEWAWRDDGDIIADIHAGDTTALFDYFASEVLGRVDPETQRFMLETAVFASATPAMAIELTGFGDAARRFARLHAQSFFTERGSAPEPSYCYHPAFRRFLLHRLAATRTHEEVAELEQRAVAILVQAGRVEEALSLLFRGGRTGAAAPLLSAIAPELHAQGRTETLREWLEQLPMAAFDDAPWLRHWRGLCRLVAARPGALEDLEGARARFFELADATGAYTSWAELIEAHTLVFQDLGVLDRLLEQYAQMRAAGLTEPDALGSKVASAHYVAMSLRRPGDPGLHALRDRALALAEATATPVTLHRLGCHMMLHDVVAGDDAHALEVQRILLRGDTTTLPPAVRLGSFFARVTYELMGAHPEIAVMRAHEGLALARETGVPVLQAELMASGALACIAIEDLPQAQAFLDELDARTNAGELPPYIGRAFVAAYLTYAIGDPRAALRVAQDGYEAMMRLGYSVAVAYSAGLLGLTLMALGDDLGARAALAICREHARSSACRRGEYIGSMLEAYRLLEAGDDDAALEAMRGALAIAATHGYAGCRFLLPKEIVRRVCRRALTSGIDEQPRSGVASRRLGIDEQPRSGVASRRLGIDGQPGSARPSTGIEVEVARAILESRGLGAGAAQRIEVRTLGRLEVLRGGAPLRTSRRVPRRPLELLEALIAFGEREVSEEVLGEALWPDAEGDAAHDALVITLRRLRALLGDRDAIRRRGRRLSVDPERIWTDVRALRDVFGAIDLALARGDDDPLAALATELLGLYRGELLPDEEQPWATAARERLRAGVVRRVGAIARRFEARGDRAQAATWYEAGLDVAELAEPLYVGLVRCQRALGRHADASATRERGRRILAAAGRHVPAELA